MLKNYWYPICRSKDIRRKLVRLKRFSEYFVLWRDEKNNLFCLSDRCCHRGSSLATGRLLGAFLECPSHGFRFNSEGKCVLIPANGVGARISAKMYVSSWKTEEANGFVWLWWGKKPELAPALPYISEFELDEKLWASVVYSKTYKMNFGRFMEATLDCQHFLYVHRAFKIPGAGPVCEPYECVIDGEWIHTAGRFRPEHSGGIKQRGASFRISVLFPNISTSDPPGRPPDEGRLVTLACPVDEENTWSAFISYEPVHLGKRLAILKSNFFLRVFVPILNWQDDRIWRYQTPTTIGIGADQLAAIPDRGIAEYHKLWKKALERSEAAPVDSRFAGSLLPFAETEIHRDPPTFS